MSASDMAHGTSSIKLSPRMAQALRDMVKDHRSAACGERTWTDVHPDARAQFEGHGLVAWDDGPESYRLTEAGHAALAASGEHTWRERR